MKYPTVLSIAGSDSGGGAGIQADIKAISACGAFACSAITALTAQNTLGVQGIFPIPVDFLEEQILSVLNDIKVDAIKIGMLHSAEVIDVVVKCLKLFPKIPVVLDPVMVATSGDRLLQENAINRLQDSLIPLATVITPNIIEAEILLGQNYQSVDSFQDFAWRLANKFKGVVLLKAGHLSGESATDLLIDYPNQQVYPLSSQRVNSTNTHGTGCTLSAALAAYIAQGLPLNEAAKKAKNYLYHTINLGANYQTGKGKGPVNHFYMLKS